MSTANRSLWGGPCDPPCLLDAFHKEVAEHPGSTAVIDEKREVNYAELMAWARGVAELLTHKGVRPEEPVAVTGPRGAGAIAAMLGVALLGAVYVPLDEEYPVKRLEYMLKDSGAKTILCTGREPRLAAGVPVIAVPDPHNLPQHGPTGERGGVTCRPDHPVYIIYTSGSTGWPKGVTIPHSCLDNMTDWQVHHSPRRGLRTAQFAPLNFDVFFQEVLGTVCGGGTVVVMPERLRREPRELLEWLGEHRIERLFLPYTALQMLAAAASVVESLGGLRLVEVNTAGEQLICTPQIRALFSRLPRCRLVNHYGQSETIMATSHILSGPSEEWPALPPLGEPLPGSEILVSPLSPEEPSVGELLIAGRPVSLGYLNHPALTAERYMDTTPTPQGHTRAFRTGDLVRVEDGQLRFLGRLDHDVKIRGVRVNLLETESQILAQPGIVAASCVVTELRPGNRSLRAAVVLSEETPELDEASVLDNLREVLPAVSVPVSITVLGELPRTPSGKINRRAVAERLQEGITRHRTRR